jgi:hypothetical protein
MKNGNRIRLMSDEELADFLEEIFTGHICNYCSCTEDDEKCKKIVCSDGICEWLEQEEAKL